jgi:hypothetical protein
MMGPSPGGAGPNLWRPFGSLIRYMNISTPGKNQRAAAMTLLALETLPCGCVAGVYQARPTVVEVEFVEAKGPHCVFSRHRTGHVTRLGVPESMVADTGEPLV